MHSCFDLCNPYLSLFGIPAPPILPIPPILCILSIPPILTILLISSILPIPSIPTHPPRPARAGMAALASAMANGGVLSNGRRLLSEATCRSFHADPVEADMLVAITTFVKGGVALEKTTKTMTTMTTTTMPTTTTTTTSSFENSMGEQLTTTTTTKTTPADSPSRRKRPATTVDGLEGCLGWMGIGGSIIQWNPEAKVSFAFVPTFLYWIDVQNTRGKKLLKEVLRCAAQSNP